MNQIIREIEAEQLKDKVDGFNVVIPLKYTVRSRKETARE